jgi:glycosyltransferase involved in cell wall biosynthesis
VSENIINLSKEKLNHNYPDSSTGKINVLSVAGLRPPKDFYCLIDAICILAKKRDVHLLIAGDGPDRAAIERYIITKDASNFITLLGYVKNPYAYMVRADVFVLSSRWEGLPNVIIEALAVGTQVVASDCKSGPREILADGRYGRLVPVGDSEEMAKAIIEAVSHPIDKNFLIQRASEFSVQASVEEYISFLSIRRKV